MGAGETPRPAIFRWGFARKLFEYAIELREGLKSRSECDFADVQITVSQQITCGDEASARDVLDKIDTGHLLEIFAQIIGVYVHRFRDFRQRKLFA